MIHKDVEYRQFDRVHIPTVAVAVKAMHGMVKNFAVDLLPADIRSAVIKNQFDTADPRGIEPDLNPLVVFYTALLKTEYKAQAQMSMQSLFENPKVREKYEKSKKSPQYLDQTTTDILTNMLSKIGFGAQLTIVQKELRDQGLSEIDFYYENYYAYAAQAMRGLIE